MSWTADVLDGYQRADLALPAAAPAPGEPATELVGTLVRRVPVCSSRAVLYLHGWNDYFFQTHVGDFFASLGYDFYALDLRRYGRSLRPEQLHGYIANLSDYDAEIDAAVARIRRRHSGVVLYGHSTGGLIAALWADSHPGEVDGIILNAPWLDLQAAPMWRAIAPPLVTGFGARNPGAVLPVPDDDGVYARALHASQGGEWEYDLDWKAPGPVPIRAGWLAAVLRGHERVAVGLDLDVPVLVLASTRSDFGRRWREDLRRVDTVLDVEQIAARSVRLGSIVTLIRFEDALHDVTLSSKPVRRRVFAEVRRWVAAYLA